MKNLFIASISILLMACSPSIVFNGENQDKDNVVKFSKHIQKVVSLNQSEHFLKHVQPQYIKEQLEGALSGNKDQFLNEFFCGKSDSTFICTDFKTINSIQLMEVTNLKSNKYKLKYLIKNELDQTLFSEIFLVKQDSSFYLFSAVG